MNKINLPEIGDLVMFPDPEITAFEKLYEEPNHLDPDFRSYSVWTASDGPGIVLEVRANVVGYKPYSRVKIAAGGKMGWCYADYVEILR